jgi:hypothetical protein
MKQILVFIIIIMMMQASFAQITINGKITDTVNGNLLPGVGISIKGTNQFAISNLEGEYEIAVPGGKNELSFSMGGMKTKVIEINNRKTINVQLENTDEQVDIFETSNRNEKILDENYLNQKKVSEFKTKIITVFKTGQVLFEKEANVDLKDKQAFFETLPFNNGASNNRIYYGQLKTNAIIGSLHFEADNNNIQETRVLENNLKLVFKKNKNNQKINLKYIQNGLMWISDYNISLGENGRGHVSLNATLINDIEDIESAEINFAVGYPYFPFSDISSPMTERKTVADMLYSLKYQSNTSERYNSQYTKNNVVVLGYGNAKKNNRKSEPIEAQPNMNFEDLLFYSKKHISIKKNETIKLPLASFDINYTNLYMTELKSSNQVVLNRGVALNNKRKNVVWRSVKFRNTSGTPLTSGIATFYKQQGGNIKHLSQGQINHIAINEFVTCKMSVVPDIIVTNSDSEERRGVKDGKNSITVIGKIKVKNHKSKKVAIEVYREIHGELINSNIQWKKNVVPNLWSANNQINNVTWSIKLEPGGESNVIYTYEYIFD